MMVSLIGSSPAMSPLRVTVGSMAKLGAKVWR
jgi:hypothetical protein